MIGLQENTMLQDNQIFDLLTLIGMFSFAIITFLLIFARLLFSNSFTSIDRKIADNGIVINNGSVDWQILKNSSELTSRELSKAKEDRLLSRLKFISEQIDHNFPGSVTELDIFSSGAMMLDVRYRDRLFVIDCTSSRGIGVDEVTEADGFNTGYNFITEDVDAAIVELNRLMLLARQD